MSTNMQRLAELRAERSKKAAPSEDMAELTEILVKAAKTFASLTGGKIDKLEEVRPSKISGSDNVSGKAWISIPGYPSMTSSQPAELWISASSSSAEGIRVQGYLMGALPAYEKVLREFPAVKGDMGSVKSRVPAYLKQLWGALQDGIKIESRRVNAEDLIEKAIPALKSVVEKALGPLGLTKLSGYGNTRLVEDQAIGLWDLVAEGLIGDIDGRVPSREEDRAIMANARKAVMKALTRFNHGGVVAKMSSKPGYWSAYRWNTTIVMYLEGSALPSTNKFADSQRTSSAKITPQQFDAMKPKQRIWLGVATGFTAPSGEVEFEVGKTSYSAKYDVYSKRLIAVDAEGKLVTGRAPWTLYKRNTGVSLAHGDMATMLKSFRMASERVANSADMRATAKTASGSYALNMLFSVVDRKAIREIEKTMKADQQSLDLLRDSQMELIDRLKLDAGGDDALSRLAGLAARGQGWDASLIRNNIFKIANSLGIRLPSGMFASTKTTANNQRLAESRARQTSSSLSSRRSIGR